MSAVQAKHAHRPPSRAVLALDLPTVGEPVLGVSNRPALALAAIDVAADLHGPVHAHEPVAQPSSPVLSHPRIAASATAPPVSV
jgi:hypothetical protein